MPRQESEYGRCSTLPGIIAARVLARTGAVGYVSNIHVSNSTRSAPCLSRPGVKRAPGALAAREMLMQHR